MSFLKHVGTPRHSGRYRWGSGKDGQQRNPTFRGQVDTLKKQGVSEVDIAKGFGLNTKQLRQKISMEKDAEWAANSAMATRLYEKGMSKSEIGRRMGKNESVIREYLDPVKQKKSQETAMIADVLANGVDKYQYVDVGKGIEASLGISRVKLENAIARLESTKKYQVLYDNTPQATSNGKKTSLKVLTTVEWDKANYKTAYAQLHANRELIQPPQGRFIDNTGEFQANVPFRQVDSKRIHIRYGDQGGEKKDGVIEIRRNVEDLYLGDKRYAQVRVGVDGTHFMKGMAMYSNDIPEGKDIVYNTNKKSGTPPGDVFKSMKSKETNVNEFGSSVTQKFYIDKNGKKQVSALNIVNEEGDWSDWSKSISSQVLSKQRPALAKKQLAIALDVRKDEFDELQALTNPAVKRRLMLSFADDCDSAAVHLKAAALPGQASHVILPFQTIKENEIYAPGYTEGTPVALIRHPHGGIFEIPVLTVNNKNKEARDALGTTPSDAVGIHPKVAQKLSGADFDGDTVLVIPNSSGAIISKPSLAALKDFDTKAAYPHYEGMTRLTEKKKQLQMGLVSNLITDMTIKGAEEDEIARAVKHSMVVIDAEKHYLNWELSAIDNNIADLKKRYQGGPTAGAATIVSRAASEHRVPLRKPDHYTIDPTNGHKIYQYYTGETTINSKGHKVKVTTPSLEVAKSMPGDTYPIKKILKDKVTKKPILGPDGRKIYYETGKTARRQTLSTKMAETADARTLLSGPNHEGTRMENLYADHANALKDMANQARLQVSRIEDTPYSHEASLTYAPEVKALNASLNNAYRRKPVERQAQLIANKAISTKRQANPDMEGDTLKKIRSQELLKARTRLGITEKDRITISDREWEAIQAGAITKSKLNEILLNTDVDILKEKALPRSFKGMSPAKIERAKLFAKTGHTTAEIADMLGVSKSIVAKALE